MMGQRTRRLLIDIVSTLFILLFVYAAFSKMEDYEKFRVELAKSPILNFVADFVAIGVPFLEIIIAIMLIIKRLQYFALYASFSLMVIFSTYIISILKFSSYIPCSCGGILENMTWGQHLFFNLFFVLAAMSTILIYPKPELKPYSR